MERNVTRVGSSVERRTAEPAALDVGEIAGRLDALHAAARVEAAGDDVELYHRVALTLRTSQSWPDARITTRTGFDEGLAVRVVGEWPRRTGFAATTGADLTRLRWALRQAREGLASATDTPPWYRGSTGLVLDLDGEPRLPTREVVLAFLAEAREALDDEHEPLELSLEVAAVVECLRGEGGPLAARARLRGSLLWRGRRDAGDGTRARPVWVASRSFRGLAPAACRAVLDDRRLPRSRMEPAPLRPVSVLFSPECAAVLVSRLCLELHAGEGPVGLPVGPAWRLASDPASAAASSGGRFDDAGFPTARVELGDGERTVARLAGPGHHCRASFRDQPAPWPAHVVVSGEADAPPETGVVVTSLEVEPAERGSWVLLVGGAHLEAGVPGARLAPSFAAVSACDLVGRCVAAVGPARRSHLGVECPALVFDGLRLESLGS